MPTTQADAEFQSCIRVLDRDDREELKSRPRAGWLLKAGVRVLEDRFARDVFREANRENEEEFRRRDCTWTDDSWRKAWFLEPGQFSVEAAGKLESARKARKQFASRTHDNITSAGGAPFPHPRVPWWLAFVPFAWEPKVKSVEEVADLTGTVVTVIEDRAGSPAGLAWPKQWGEFLAGLNDVKVYTIQSGRNVAHVVSAFVTPLKVQKQEPPAIAPLDQTVIDAVQKAYSVWCQDQGGSKPLFAFLTIGGVDCPSAESSAAAAGDHWLLVSCRDGPDHLRTSVPRRFGDRPSIRDFVDRLKPETNPERVSRIKDCVDDLIPQGGNVTVEKVKERTDYRRSVIQRAFLTLQKEAGDTYRIYKTTDAQYAIRKSRPGEKIGVRAGSLRRGLMRRHGLRLTGIGLGLAAALAREWLHISSVIGLLAFIPFLYLASCVQSALNRHADNSKE